MKNLLIFLFVLFMSQLQAADFRISIEGKFPGAEGQVVRLLEYADMVSYHEREIGSDKVDENGNFSINLIRYRPQYVFFRIDHARMGFFIEPGQTYLLEFEPVDFAQLDDSRNPYINPWFFHFRIVEPAVTLNHHIDKLEDVFHEFLIENFARIHQSRNRRLFDEFRSYTDSLFGHIDNEYFKDYYEYKYAYYYRIAGIERFDNQIRVHLLNRPVLYHNTQYMNFFNTVFDTYVFAGSRTIQGSDLRHTVNRLNSYDALMDSLGKDTILRNEVIRELVMLKALQSMHNDPDYRQQNVESILNYINTNSKFSEHRAVAGNILFERNNLVRGVPSPSFVVFDGNDNPVRIPDDFQGKFIYLGFWASWCENCMLEFIALGELFEQYRNDIVFINISTERNPVIFDAYLNSTDRDWLDFHFRHDFHILDAFKVRALPTFVLFDTSGNILDYPALKPSDNLNQRFERILNQRFSPGSQR